MKVEVEPGKYVLAVSGGVDSMVLLDLLANRPGIGLIVAHFNHGIRRDAERDEEFVGQRAAQLGLAFESGRADLGEGASEDSARRARYGFLHHIQKKHGAKAIITAHHQDDLIETVFINLLRGTGRKGLVAIQNSRIVRPLLGYRKRDILKYAADHRLKWQEDETNREDNYLRNYLRLHVLEGMSDNQRIKILENIKKIEETDSNIDTLIAKLSQYVSDGQGIDRAGFSSLPLNLGEELITFWLRQHRLQQFDKKTVNRLSVALKTARPDTVHPVHGELKLLIGQRAAHFSHGL
jgi:tRNA(Ile)-lysidine synthase